MKVKIKIAELAEQHGFKKAYALQKALDISPTMAARLWSGEFKQIGIETIEKLCELFKCSPNDLFGFDVVPVAPVPENPKQEVLTAEDFAPLKSDSGKFKHSALDIVQNSSDNEFNLTTADAGKLLGLSPRTVRENAEKGLLPGKQGKQNHWFFRRSDVDGFNSRRG